MADDPRAVRLARRRMLTETKPKPKLSLPVRGFRKRGERMKKLDHSGPIRLKVRK